MLLTPFAANLGTKDMIDEEVENVEKELSVTTKIFESSCTLLPIVKVELTHSKTPFSVLQLATFF